MDKIGDICIENCSKFLALNVPKNFEIINKINKINKVLLEGDLAKILTGRIFFFISGRKLQCAWISR